MQTANSYIQRCLQLAEKGAGMVAPNPMVGALLVYEDRIIAEGWHQNYGQAHAEVNCINNVEQKDQSLISKATLYVSLEPCSHFGKTPPCADLIIQNKIKKVIVGCVDPYSEVSGQGIQKMREAGIDVSLGPWEKQCLLFNKRFITFHQQKRPYIILKWAQTSNKMMAAALQKDPAQRLRISNEITDRLVHKWRSEEAAIMIGKNTALLDNPVLTNRWWTGHHPTRLVIDNSLNIPLEAKILNKEAPTILFNQHKDEQIGNLRYIKIPAQQDQLFKILQKCYDLALQSILVEGGPTLLQSFMDQHLWDECRIITNPELHLQNGIKAPQLENATHLRRETYYKDKIDYFAPQNNQ